MKKLWLFLLVLVLTACRQTTVHTAGGNLDLKYATLLHMEECDSFTHVVIQNAWVPNTPMAAYVLVPRNQKVPQQHPEGQLLRTPLERAVLHSSVHAALLCDLQAEKRIAGMADTNYVISPRLKALFNQGVKDAGSSMQPDLEKLHQLKADAVLVSPFENAGHGVLDRAGVPLIECADYMETSPLGRAEWMRFYGRLFGEAERADSLFSAIELEYHTLKAQIAQRNGSHPSVFCDLRTGNVWYQPGGASTTGQSITDAGGDYLWRENTQQGGMPLDLESVYAKAHDADIWLVKYGRPVSLTYAHMAQECPAYARFKAWKERKVYACNTLHTPFYEEVPFHPERLLTDLATIFHPDTTSAAALKYYRPLEQE